ncbi:MAG TPA: hypothetical protein V6D08_07860, partial [Candidatus Obscuribacterales bacterium]
MEQADKGFITILTGLYAFQDCFHFLASVRKFHTEPIAVLIDAVPKILQGLLTSHGNVTLVPAPSHENPQLASRLAKVALYELSPFSKTLYLDCDTCLLTNVAELFDLIGDADLVLTEDPQRSIGTATHLLRQPLGVVHSLNATGLTVTEDTVQYNGGLVGFGRSEGAARFFCEYKRFFERVLRNQHLLNMRDQGALAAAVEKVKPSVRVLPANYNYLHEFAHRYSTAVAAPIKIMHCRYPRRP